LTASAVIGRQRPLLVGTEAVQTGGKVTAAAAAVVMMVQQLGLLLAGLQQTAVVVVMETAAVGGKISWPAHYPADSKMSASAAASASRVSVRQVGLTCMQITVNPIIPNVLMSFSCFV